MKRVFLTASALVATTVLSVPLFAQAAPLILRQGTTVTLALQEPLSSKTSKMGDRFQLKTSEPVKVSGVVVIPVGTPAVGEVTKVVKKGAFGKSGKLETRLLHVRLGDETIGLTGVSNEAGEGGTGATVAVAVIAGVFSAFVTGTSAEYPVGAVMNGYIASDQPMVAAAMPAPIAIPAAAPLVVPAAPVAAPSAPVPATVPVKPAG